MSLKKTFSSDGKKCTVVFTVNPEAAAGATKVYLAGDFNSWDPTSIPMKKDPTVLFLLKSSSKQIKNSSSATVSTVTPGLTTGRQTSMFAQSSLMMITL